MSWLYTAYTALLFATSGGLIVLAIFAWQRRTIVGAISFLWLALVVSEWVLTYALELTADSVAT